MSFLTPNFLFKTSDKPVMQKLELKKNNYGVEEKEKGWDELIWVLPTSVGKGGHLYSYGLGFKPAFMGE